MSKIFLASIFATVPVRVARSASAPNGATINASAHTAGRGRRHAGSGSTERRKIRCEGRHDHRGRLHSAGRIRKRGDRHNRHVRIGTERVHADERRKARRRRPSSAPIASSYRLDAVDSKLSPHVGHKVEISGTLQPPTGSSPSSATASPTLKVDNVKMLAATCTN